MPSDDFVEIGKRIAKENKALFDAIHHAKTTKKTGTKTRLNFTIDKSVASHFKKFCRDHGYNMSAKVEQAMRRMMQP